MTRKLKVGLFECEGFFGLGVKKIMSEHLFHLNFLPIFSSDKEHNDLDIVVIMLSSKKIIYPCQFLMGFNFVRLGGIVIYESHDKKIQRYTSCLHEVNAMNVRDTPDMLVSLLNKVLSEKPVEGAFIKELCPNCKPVLTAAERFVMHGLAMGHSATYLAEMLGLSPKTISAHKRNGMKKMGLRRNTELYHWLNCGGLDY